VLAALHLSEPCTDGLVLLDDGQWRKALAFCDRSRLTLALREKARDVMPQWARDRTDENASNNRQRLTRIEDAYRELAETLEAAGVGFLTLKGITQCALFGGRPELRPQYDIDLFAPPEDIYRARNALQDSGYEPVAAMKGFPTDHLPVMVRQTGWEWHNDYFDVEIPLSVDLHFQFWDESVERLAAPGVGEFWGRRIGRQIGGAKLSVLNAPDALGYTALHLLRHLLRGSVTPFHVYEMAGLLDSLAGEPGFWAAWRAQHAPGLRRLEAVAFRLAHAWFGCGMALEVEEETAELSPATKAWFAEFATSPASALYYPNKDEIWLHCTLLDSPRDAWSVARRRLLPVNLPPVTAAVFVPKDRLTWRQRIDGGLQWMVYTSGRVWHHGVALPRIAASALRGWSPVNSMGRQFWLFLAAACVFNFALFVFVLLYNLFLADLGFREDALGLVNGANRLGSLVGTLPAALVAHRFGLRKTLLVTIGGTAAAELLRAFFSARAPATVLGFASGCIFALWAVTFAPLIVNLADEKRRPAAFSIFFAAMFGVGIAGNWIGGQLPQWLHGKQPVLVLSAGLSALALWPAIKLRPRPALVAKARVYPRSGFLLRFLVAFALWHLATGAFNPFANVYFAGLHFSVDRIGNIFSLAQVPQTVAVLLAPLVYRKCGLAVGISWMMLATALGLGGLAAQAPGLATALVYTAYMSFQWMSEPGLNTLLLGRVAEGERSGAAALGYLVAFGAQALAAFAGGGLVARFGYGVVLAGAAALAAAAAGLFRVLLGAGERFAPRVSNLPAVGASNAEGSR
jgi:MFS family permease